MTALIEVQTDEDIERTLPLYPRLIGINNHQIETVASYASEGQISQLANWSADVENEAGETVTYQGVLMTVLQQDADGEWQVASHIWNMAQ